MFQSTPGRDWPGDLATRQPDNRRTRFNPRPAVIGRATFSPKLTFAGGEFQSTPGRDWPGDTNAEVDANIIGTFQSTPGRDWPGDAENF